MVGRTDVPAVRLALGMVGRGARIGVKSLRRIVVIATGRRSSPMTWLLASAALANAAAAALTFFLPDLLNGPAVMNGSARGTALIMLVLGVPLVLASILLEGRGSRWTSAVRLGALAYLAYNAFLLLFATPFNRLFLVYVVALSSSAFALGVSLARADGTAVALHLPRVPARVLGGYIWTIVVLNALAWLRTIVPAMVATDPTSFLEGTGIATNPIYVQDLVFWLPSATLIGWLVWTRRPWGALLAGSYLVYGLLESIGVATDQWFGSSADPTSEVATMGAVVIFAVLAVFGTCALLYYAYAARSASSPVDSGAAVHHPRVFPLTRG
jgi:hypothetical protein